MYLNCHSYYSLRYGTMAVETLVKEAAGMGIDALALTDINTSMGVVDFIRACRTAGIHPMAGIEFRNGDRYLYTGIARNPKGFSELNEFLSYHNESGLPFPDHVFDGATVAFGVRNFHDPLIGLAEIHRVLRPGGRLAVLEFSMPRQPMRFFYDLYFRYILPHLGGLITGTRSPYEYLPASVHSFPEGRAFLDLMGQAGFDNLTARRLSGGIVTYYRGDA